MLQLNNTLAKNTPSTTWLKLIVLLVLLIGISARFYGLEYKLVWHDEVFTVVRILGFEHKTVLHGIYNAKIQTPDEILRFQRAVPEQGLTEAWHAILEHPEHPPLYYMLAAVAAQFMPDSPIIAARGIAVFFSLLFFPAIFWLAWEWSQQIKVAWVILALAAVSPLHLLYAQEARQYSLLMLLIAAACAAFLRALRQQRWQDWAIYNLCLTLGLYTHLLFVQIFLAHTMYLAWMAWQRPDNNTWRNLWHTLIVFCIAGIAFIPWLIVIITKFAQFKAYTHWLGRSIVSLKVLSNLWLGHINRLFIDIPEINSWWAIGVDIKGMNSWWVIGTVIIFIILWSGLRRAKSPMVWFILCLITPVIFISIVPDIIFGGSRSKEVRYFLQPLIGLELGMAWSLAYYIFDTHIIKRAIAIIGFGIFLSLGLYSQFKINQTDTWWNKSLSEDNAKFAQVINQAENPLVLTGLKYFTEGGAGEFMSMSYKLNPNVSLLAQISDETKDIPPSYKNIFLLMPSFKIISGLRAQNYEVSWYNWKWFTATLKHDAKTIKAAALEPIFYDHFEDRIMDFKSWYIPPRRDNNTQLGTTMFRTTRDYPSLPQVQDHNAFINVETYNPVGSAPFYGTDLISNEDFTAGEGISIRVRAKMNAPIQPGIVGGIFLFARKNTTDTLHDEIDFEFLTNSPHQISTNIYSNQLLGDGHPIAYPHPIDSMYNYHTYEIQWLPNKVTWLVDGVVIRTTTENIPIGPMHLHLNMWVPYKNWKEAYSPTLRHTNSPKDNKIFTMQVDAVKVERIVGGGLAI